MKIILAGHEESKKILPASSWLLNKYAKGFDIKFLNYGDYDGELFTGEYIKLDEEQKGGVKSWAKYIKDYLRTLCRTYKDHHIIFALDDFFINDTMEDVYLDKQLGLCNLSKEWDPNNKEYSCTAQYTIWNIQLLMNILGRVETPWEFELEGSKYLNDNNEIPLHKPVMSYSGESALSSRHPGKVSVKGLKKDDVEELISKGYLNREELIIGQPMGEVKKYE